MDEKKEVTIGFMMDTITNFKTVGESLVATNGVLHNHKEHIMANTQSIKNLGWIVGIGFGICYFSVKSMKRQIKALQNDPNTVINNVASPVEEEA